MSSPPNYPSAQARRESFARRQESLIERVSRATLNSMLSVNNDVAQLGNIALYRPI